MSQSKSWTPEQLAAHIKDVCGTVVAERLESLQRTVKDHGDWITAAANRPAKPAESPEKGLVAAGVIAALAGTRGDLKQALANAKSSNADESIIKALEASSVSGGGALITPQFSSDFIDLLTPRAIVRSFGTTVLPMDSGTMQISKLNAAAAAYYIGENQQATKSQQAFGIKKLNAKKLAALVPVSNDLLRRGGPKVSTIIRNDTLRTIALKEDVTFIRAAGGDYSPKGLYNLMAAANRIAANGTVNLANVTTDLGNVILALEEANVAMTNPGWMFAPRTKQYLLTVRDGLGNFAFRDEILRGTLWGWPFRTTTQIPKNLTAGSATGNGSEVYLVDFDDVVIGQTMGLEVAVSTEASYVDETGSLVSAFSLDQTVMRVILEHDIQMRHDESAAALIGVTWGV